jgi:hypothetical protein
MIRATALVASALFLFGCAMAAGCAAPGEPNPRHPVVPAPVTDLAAQQSGISFDLRFTLPTRSTDREALSEHPAIEIYRLKLPPGAVPNKKAPWPLAYVVPSEQVERYLKGEQIEFNDPLMPDDFAGPTGSSFAYKVRTREAKSQTSADSNVVVARAYPPPDAPQNVKAGVTEKTIEIAWTAPAGARNALPPYSYRVYRQETELPAPDQANAPNAGAKVTLVLLGETTETRFEDQNFEFDRTYTYSARSVAHFGAEAVESDQPASSMTTVTPRDVFPPAAPAGVEVALIPATLQAPAYIELSWAISTEPDLAGYYVYRSEDENSPGKRISTEILPSPVFRDISVQSGKRYFYQVTALDRAGNESPKSSATTVAVP